MVSIGITWDNANAIKLSKKIMDPVSRVKVLWAKRLEVKSAKQAPNRKKKIIRATEAVKTAKSGYRTCNGKRSCNASTDNAKINKLKNEISSAWVFSKRKKTQISSTNAISGNAVIPIITA